MADIHEIWHYTGKQSCWKQGIALYNNTMTVPCVLPGPVPATDIKGTTVHGYQLACLHHAAGIRQMLPALCQ